MKLRGATESSNKRNESQNSQNIFKFNENGTVNVLRESTMEVINQRSQSRNKKNVRSANSRLSSISPNGGLK